MIKSRKSGIEKAFYFFALAVTCVFAFDAHAQSGPVPSGSPIDPSRSAKSSGGEAGSAGVNSTPWLQGNGTDFSLNDPVFSPVKVNDPAASSAILKIDPAVAGNMNVAAGDNLLKTPPAPGEFQSYIQRLLGRNIPLFGAKLVLPALRDFAAPATSTVPPDYVVQPGDTIDIALAGSLDGSVSRTVDTDGRVFLTGVGALRVAGVRNSDLRDVIAREIRTKYRGFTVAVTITKLRGIRVYVTGLANNPGAFTVSGLSTLANAVFQAGGPNSGGSWRAIKLYRNGHELADFDLYQLMRGGSRVNDIQLQNEDVLFIPPAGPQVAVVGSVNEEAIYEARENENVQDMLAAAGGPNTVGDASRFVLYRAGDPDQVGPQQLEMRVAAHTLIQPGDIIQLLSTGTLAMPIERQKVMVRIEGEVRRPGIFSVDPGTNMAAVIAQAGGLTANAYPFGAKLTRESERLQQQESYIAAVNQLEMLVATAPLNANMTIAGGESAAQMVAARSVIEQLRQARPDGRIVLDIASDAIDLPGSIALQNNDTIFVPSRSSTVGVFGAVYRPSSFLIDSYGNRMKVRDYIDMAGGTLRIADRGGVFLVRANGSVISKKRGALSERVLPGDVVFMPIRTQPNMFWTKLSSMASTLLALGLSATAILTAIK